MASWRGFHAKPNFIYPTDSSEQKDKTIAFEFDESDIWNSSDHIVKSANYYLEGKKGIMPNSREAKKMTRKTCCSLPVNIPDWSKILKDDYNNEKHKKRESIEHEEFEEEEEEEDDYRLPPHEYLARTRGSSPSVHEGIGRTLKGRDLSRLRNAIWKKTGFED